MSNDNFTRLSSISASPYRAKFKDDMARHLILITYKGEEGEPSQTEVCCLTEDNRLKLVSPNGDGWQEVIEFAIWPNPARALTSDQASSLVKGAKLYLGTVTYEALFNEDAAIKAKQESIASITAHKEWQVAKAAKKTAEVERRRKVLFAQDLRPFEDINEDHKMTLIDKLTGSPEGFQKALERAVYTVTMAQEDREVLQKGQLFGFVRSQRYVLEYKKGALRKSRVSRVIWKIQGAGVIDRFLQSFERLL